MKVKLDENLPARLAVSLGDKGHKVDTVADEGLNGRPDVEVWAASCQHERFFITQDLDFSDVRQFRPGSHPGLLLVRLRNPGANALLEHISAALEAHPLEALAGCFAVLTEHKLRIRRP